MSRLIASVVLGLACMAACTPGDVAYSPVFAQTPTSLLFVTPCFGDENSGRDPFPVPERLPLNEESVIGWLSPPEKLIRFPLELRDGAHLSLRLGVTTETSINRGTLAPIIECTPAETQPSAFSIALDEIYPDQISADEWIDVDIPLTGATSGRWEIGLRLEGSLSGNRDIQFLWGQPTVYYPEERRHKNILLIGVDTLRQDPLSVYGGRFETTPNMERLCRHATVFNNAWSQAPWTVPSFESMITGLYPADLSPTLSTEQLPESATTLGEILLPEGYATAMICGNAYLGNENSGFHQGIESSWYRLSATPSDSVDRATDFIERSTDRDWFLFLHFMDPHGPYDPPPEFTDSLCDPEYEGRYRTAFEDGLEWQLATSRPPESDINRVRCLYDAEVADLDAAMGDLFSFLEESDLLDETLIIFAADHGEEFFEHGEFEHGQSLFEEQVHLPLIVWGPDFPDGANVGSPVANLDIAPTILTFCEQTVPVAWKGVALQDVITGNVDENRIIFGEGNLRRSSHRKFAVDWPYKCILDFFTGETRLYDLLNDPEETIDLSVAYPEITDRLSREMILEMLPIQTLFVLTMLGDPARGPNEFSGTISVPGGVAFVTDSGFLDGDVFTINGETIDFSFTTETTREDPIKALIIVPAPGADSIEADLLSDGQIDPDRFYPYATSTPEPTGSATLNIYDFPWPALLPPDAQDLPVACYIIGIPGFPRGESGVFEPTELDPETREQLRALGYIN